LVDHEAPHFLELVLVDGPSWDLRSLTLVDLDLAVDLLALLDTIVLGRGPCRVVSVNKWQLEANLEQLASAIERTITLLVENLGDVVISV